MKKTLIDTKMGQQQGLMIMDMDRRQRRMMAYFYHTLPSSFQITNNVFYGQCNIQHHHHHSKPIFEQDSSQININENQRFLARFITNNYQILILEILCTDQRSFYNRYNKYYRIRFTDILEVKLSQNYCDILIVYRDDIKGIPMQYLIIEAICLGTKRSEQLRHHILKYLTFFNKGNRLDKYSQDCLLNYQQYLLARDGFKGDKRSFKDIMEQYTKNLRKGKKYNDEQDDSGTKETDKNKKYYQSDLREPTIINLRAKCQQIKAEQSKNKQNINQTPKSLDLKKMYKIYSEISEPTTTLIAKKIIDKQSSTNTQACTLKIFKKSQLNKQRQQLQSLINQSQIFKRYELITSYVPQLNKVIQTGDFLIYEYAYYEGRTIDQLLKKDRLQIQKNSLRRLIAEIVMGLGQIHQCGFLYGPVTLHNVIINVDGHVLLTNLDLRKIEDPVTKPKSILQTSPEQLKNKGQKSFSSDWWCLGLLIYQIVTKKSYFDGKTQQQIAKILLDESQSSSSLQALKKPLQKQQQLLSLVTKLLRKNTKKRAGKINDYHSILNQQYLKGENKKKLMRRQGEPILNIKKTKMDKQLKEVQILNRSMDSNYRIINHKYTEREMKPIGKGSVADLIKHCLLDYQAQADD